MADTNLRVLNGDGDPVYIKEHGAGTNLDPNIGIVGIDQATANANEVVLKAGTVTTVSTVTAVTTLTNALPAGTAVIGKVGVSSYPALRTLEAKTLAVTTVEPIASFNFGTANLAAATYMTVNTFTTDANYLCAGTPTATFGIPLQAGQTVVGFDGNAEINAFQVVSQSGTAGTANVTVVLYNYP
jgi:hypothetical protein